MIQTRALLNSAIVVTGESVSDVKSGGTFQSTITGTGSLTATILVQASLDNTYWVTLATTKLVGTTNSTEGFVSLGEWVFYRAVLSSISGTNAVVTVNMSEVT